VRYRSPLTLASGLILAHTLGLASALTSAEPPAPAVVNPSSERPADYVVAFWYLRADPLTSLRHKVYDVRKGQYTRAVTDWLETMRTRYPTYAAYLKEVRLSPDSGATEAKQLATVILQEYVEKGGPYGGLGIRDEYGLYGGAGRLDGLVRPGSPRPLSDLNRRSTVSEYIRGYGFVASPGANRPPNFLSSPGQGSSGLPGPFPYPYVRPHP
jgi:hypothetical protein